MANKDILDSWKEISEYLQRGVRTCYRWEKELGLPVHRFDNSSRRSSVFAYKSEIDEWMITRGTLNKLQKKSFLRGKHLLFLGIALLIVILFSASAFLYISLRNPNDASVTLAIFPLECPSSLRDQKYLIDGIFTELRDNLSKEEKFRIITADYPDKYVRRPDSLINLGKKLNADFLLKGNVENDGNRDKLVFEFIKTEGGLCLWNVDFYDFADNTLEICKNVYFKIYEELNYWGNNDEAPFVEEFNPDREAFDNYLKGNFVLGALEKKSEDPWDIYYEGQYHSILCTKESNELAVKLFSVAIEIDPNFAPAYVGLANCYANFLNFAWYYDLEWLQKAEDLLERANELSPNMPAYFSTLSKVYLMMASGFNLDTLNKAYEVAEKGIKQYPNDSDINSKISFFYYLKFGETGNESNLEKALSYMKNCYLVRPYDTRNIYFADLLLLNKEFHAALDICDQISKISKSLALDYQVATICYCMGDLERSRFIYENQKPNMNSIITSLFLLGKIAAQKNEVGRAIGYAERILALTPDLKQFSISQFEVASIYFGISRKNLGYKHLSQFFGYPETETARYIYHKYIELDKNFDEVRNEERFKDIINGRSNGEE